MKYTNLVLVLLVLIFIACGQEEATEPAIQGNISGTIYDALEGDPIDKAKVITTPPSSAVTTAADGSYSINNVDPGVYRVNAAKLGFDSSSVNITVSAGNTAIADIPLLADTLSAN